MPNRRFILGTAGHVDHGKTELVKRLTGWDTDRLKEEKERGISIELGFAPLRLDDDTICGIVDVPGHERFVKHMVAGTGGIDAAILVIAADEGVMPQTREHLEVLRSLHVTHGLVVLTKMDLADAGLLEVVKADVDDLVRGTFLEGARVIEASARTGAGIDVLTDALRALFATVPARDTSGPFRLAVDRVFHMQGIGVVVTGSCYSGTIAVGDALELLPSEKQVRVREIQSFGEKREHGYAGERLAVAVQGVKLAEVARGEMLTTPSRFEPGPMIDARVRIASYLPFELKPRQRVRLHHGAREVLGRAVLLDVEGPLRSGDEGLVQFRLEKPVVAGEGDYFVIRTYSPALVLGGGRVINATARKHRAGDAKVLDDLAVREAGDPAERAMKMVHDAGAAGLKADEVDEAIVGTLVGDGSVVMVGTRIFAAEEIGRIADRIEALTVEFVAANPLRYGIDKEELRQKVGFPHAATLFNRLLELIARDRALFTRGNLVRAGSREVEPPARLAGDLRTLEAFIRDAGIRFSRRNELDGTWRAREALVDALQYLRDRGRVHRIGDDGYLHDDAFTTCVRQVSNWFSSHDDISVVELKDLLGITRKHAIPLLEYLDERHYTIRRGNARVAGPALEEQ